MIFTRRSILLLLLVVAASFTLFGEENARTIEIGTPFSDNAILQRDMEVPVWGWSKPGSKVTVDFAGQQKSATAGRGASGC